MLHFKRFVLLVSLSIATSAYADTKIPAAIPGSSLYKQLSEFMEGAKADYKLYRYGEYGLINGSGAFAVAFGKKGLPNNGKLVFRWNSNYYLIPLRFVEVGNIQEITYDENGVSGIYLKIQGFRINSNTDMPDHMTAVVRFARRDGSALPSLNYHETGSPAATPDYRYLYPAINPRPGKALPFTSGAGAGFLASGTVEEANPGSQQYAVILNNLRAARSSGDTSMYYNFGFRGLEGELVGAGPDEEHVHLDIRLANKYFSLPTEFTYVENLNVMTRETGKTNGLYLVQRGFQYDSVSGQFYEVTSKTKFCGLDGSVPSTLTYEESARPAITESRVYIFEKFW
jgi:hypothetical protein